MRVFLADRPDLLDHSTGPCSSSDSAVLDLQCLAALEQLLDGLLAPLQEPPEDPLPLWWPLCGALVQEFRESQCALVAANLAAVRRVSGQLQVAQQAAPS